MKMLPTSEFETVRLQKCKSAGKRKKRVWQTAFEAARTGNFHQKRKSANRCGGTHFVGEKQQANLEEESSNKS